MRIDLVTLFPEWFHSPYTSAGKLDEALDVQSTGDIATNKG